MHKSNNTKSLRELDDALDRLCGDLQSLTETVACIMNNSFMRMGRLHNLKMGLRGPKRKVNKAIGMLKTLQNYFCPAHAMVPHIWQRIFEFAAVNVEECRLDPPRSIHACRRRTDLNQLATLAAVCHYWHAVCTTTPSLWRDVSSCGSPLQSLVLKRYPAVPLEVTLLGSEIPDIMWTVPAPHCRTLSWSECTYDVICTCGYILSESSDTLEDLTITDDGYYEDDEDDEDDANDDDSSQPAAAPTVKIFSESTSRLRSVSLCGLTWVPEDRFTTITTMFIGRCAWSNPVSTVLNILRDTPNLVDLVLSDTLDHDKELREEGADQAGKVYLPSLRRLSFHDISAGSASVALLLSKLILTHQATVLVYDTRGSSAQDVQDDWLPDALYRYGLDVVEPTSLQLQFFQTPPGGLSDGNVSMSVWAVSQRGGLLLRNKCLRPVPMGPDWRYCFADFFRLRQLRDLRYLERRVYPKESLWPVRMWSSLLPEMEELRQLTVYGHSLGHMARAISDGDWLERVEALCPRLSRITVLLSGASPPLDSIMTTLSTIRADIPFSSVTIAYLPDYYRVRYQSAHDSRFKTVKHCAYDNVPTLRAPWRRRNSDLPDLPMAYWPVKLLLMNGMSFH
ncbi:uncharacterized protein B0H18DRAFT_991018 [Fomitopsis serialis]|uniref:uncharacterized protein n=1 Tax=Fomitopsis serialis TaxID=139415 RepID=UPI0020073239|nr:uncharacterized protein B0H18DRAFT_991018 [Neoantrodia serialis]KAH9931294.1 hypothetical protein B0H18DRAFT_991018 [Neoantrodia serialis]